MCVQKAQVNRDEARLSQGGPKARPMMRAACLHLAVPASATFLALTVCRNKGPQVRIPTLSRRRPSPRYGKRKMKPFWSPGGNFQAASHPFSCLIYTETLCGRGGESHFTDEETDRSHFPPPASYKCFLGPSSGFFLLYCNHLSKYL